MIYLCIHVGLYLSTQTAQDIGSPIHTDRPTQAYNKHIIHIGLHKSIINVRHMGLTYIHTYRITPVYINAHTYIQASATYKHTHIGLRLNNTYRPSPVYINAHTQLHPYVSMHTLKYYLTWAYAYIKIQHIGLFKPIYHKIYTGLPAPIYI